jgi:hypothetical protein
MACIISKHEQNLPSKLEIAVFNHTKDMLMTLKSNTDLIQQELHQLQADINKKEIELSEFKELLTNATLQAGSNQFENLIHSTFKVSNKIRPENFKEFDNIMTLDQDAININFIQK